ncbi:HI1506-related protein [Roseibium litorale]|uniref:Mu-like prophage FluMu N-terminal domain-containing protein n=1 Tax=Roseibium litorale TaxID=2803841 RepID=A0ABR9CHH3_9HYPH|nr:HI1506-related protein [Roseibium litorale]MBD8890154.1 hypothetical protein [Roseibium litorale]
MTTPKIPETGKDDAKEKAGASKAKAGERAGGLRISAKREGGIRRAGVRHSFEATDHPEGTFTAKEIEQLKADPDLVVVEI